MNLQLQLVRTMNDGLKLKLNLNLEVTEIFFRSMHFGMNHRGHNFYKYGFRFLAYKFFLDFTFDNKCHYINRNVYDFQILFLFSVSWSFSLMIAWVLFKGMKKKAIVKPCMIPMNPSPCGFF